MNEPSKIYGLLVKAMQQIPVVPKGQSTESGPRFKYRGIDDLRNVIHPLFAELGIVVIPTVLDAIHDTVEKTDRDGTIKIEFRARLRVQFTLYADDGSSVSAVVESESIDSRDKGTMQAMSVAEKILYIALFILETGDTENEQHEDGHEDGRQSGQPQQSGPSKQVDGETGTPAVEVMRTKLRADIEIAMEAASYTERDVIAARECPAFNDQILAELRGTLKWLSDEADRQNSKTS